MSNLGEYQVITTVAKKVGGPKNLIIITAASGYIGLRLVESGIKFGTKVISNILNSSKKDDTIYRITEDGISNDGLIFKTGDAFRVLEKDKDAILIEMVDNTNNPYFISANLLKEISNYNISLSD